MIEPGVEAPDFTPGCTVQACGVRDRAAEYEAANAVVLGALRELA
jgi:peroxiredoxin